VKLKEAKKIGFVRRLEKFGIERAIYVARMAVKWGNSAAKSWVSDFRFAQYLTMIDVNGNTCLGV